MLRFLWVSILLFCYQSIAYAQAANWQQYPTPTSFSHIHIDAPLQVSIRDGAKSFSVRVYRPDDFAEKINMTIQKDRLVIQANKIVQESDIPIKVEISLPRLSTLSYEDQAQITLHKRSRLPLTLLAQGNSHLKAQGDITLARLENHADTPIELKRVKSRDLILHNYGNADIQLHGQMHLKEIKHYGDGRVTLNRVRGGSSNIHAKNHAKLYLYGHLNLQNVLAEGHSSIWLEGLKDARMQITLRGNSRANLSGHSEMIQATLWQHSQLNTQRLRTKNVYITTHGQATAHVIPVNLLAAQAFDRSDIYYYQRPQVTEIGDEGSGSVLPMFYADSHLSKNHSDGVFYK
jgi:hypothetical protein